MTAQTITNLGFLSEFLRRHEQMTDRPFCWVLGSGASVQSGIPSGGKLTQQWLAEMYEMEPHGELSIEEWATAETLGIKGFESANAARSYPWIYQRRFRDYPEQGYAFLEKIMDKAEPSFGYSVLAQIMATTRHKVAITTNFDNLIADALSTYTRTFPLVCGHESLTGYIRANLRRPLVAKIHRDLLLAPLSKPDEISSLPKEWTSALTKIFSSFTPIVLGYGGNDGSLMNFLKAVSPIEGGIFWCHRQGDAVDPVVSEVVEQHHGRLVPIVGFDELMLQFWEKLQLQSPLPQLQSVHDKRREGYQKQFEALTAALREPAENTVAEEARKPVREAADAAVERLTKEKDWWAWALKAKAEPDPVAREAIYVSGLEDFPQSASLTVTFANFMCDVRRNYDEAERLYRRALELDPTQSSNIASFAAFTSDVRRNYDEAERLYRLSMALEPDNPYTAGFVANFMSDVRKDYDEAEKFYLHALELDPNQATNIGNYASFLVQVKKNYNEAEKLYRHAIELDPNSSTKAGNFAQFLASRSRSEEARGFLKNTQPNGQPTQNHAELAFTLWLLDRASSRNNVRALGRVRAVIEAGFLRVAWSFDDLLAKMLPCLPENERLLAQKVASAILDEAMVPALNDEPLWTATIPVPLSVPWSEIAEDEPAA
jgi:tetratricopeptide (TPR) repeat protein